MPCLNLQRVMHTTRAVAKSDSEPFGRLALSFSILTHVNVVAITEHLLLFLYSTATLTAYFLLNSISLAMKTFT